MQFEEKPRNMPLKDFIVIKLAERMQLPKETIEAIIQNQFVEINKALQDVDALSVEMSGFGRFYFTPHRGIRALEKIGHSLSVGNPGKTGKRPEIKTMIEDEAYITQKMDAYDRKSKANHRGVVKHYFEKKRGGGGSEGTPPDMPTMSQALD